MKARTLIGIIMVIIGVLVMWPSGIDGRDPVAWIILAFAARLIFGLRGNDESKETFSPFKATDRTKWGN